MTELPTFADLINADEAPAVPGSLLSNAGEVDAETFIPQRGMGLTVGQDSTPPEPDTPARPAQVAARDAELLPPGPFQAPEFKRPGETPVNQVADKFAAWRKQLEGGK